MKQHFHFTSNALKKLDFIKALFTSVLNKSKQPSLFKKLWAEHLNVAPEQVFLMGAGRMGVYLYLKNLNPRPDEEVILAGYTCVVLSNAVKFAGYKAVYVDVEKTSTNLQYDLLLQAITPKTKAIIIPHNFGLAWTKISDIKSLYPHIKIIEDAAHAIANVDKVHTIGTMGDCSFFSLEYSKPITTGLGGVFVINNPDEISSFSAAHQQLPYFPKIYTLKILFTLGGLNQLYFKSSSLFLGLYFAIMGKLKLVYATSKKEVNGTLPDHYPIQLSPTLAGIGVYQMKRLSKLLEEKREIMKAHHAFTATFKDIINIEIKESVLVRYPLLFSDRVSNEQLNNIRNEAKRNGYAFGEWFNDEIHPKGSYRYCFIDQSCPNGAFLAQRTLNLPVNINSPLTAKDYTYLKQLFNKHGIQ